MLNLKEDGQLLIILLHLLHLISLYLHIFNLFILILSPIQDVKPLPIFFQEYIHIQVMFHQNIPLHLVINTTINQEQFNINKDYNELQQLNS